MQIDLATAFWTGFSFSIFTSVLGFYVGERGWSGVKIDLDNVKMDIANIKGKLEGAPKATVITPVAVTPAPTVTATPNV